MLEGDERTAGSRRSDGQSMRVDFVSRLEFLQFFSESVAGCVGLVQIGRIDEVGEIVSVTGGDELRLGDRI